MHVFFSAGEPSGDQHAAALIQALRQRLPDLRVTGLGGPRMEAAGCHLLYPLTNLAVMGIFAVLPKVLEFYRVYRQTKAYLQAHRPDVVVLIDFPGFNWWIASAARAAGVRVVYYLPPQLWAWAPWRIRKVRRLVDLVLAALPFEARWYAERKIPTLYVGHPFFDDVAQHSLDDAFVREWTSQSGPTVALLPGSRGHEVTGNWPLLLEAARRIHEKHPRVQFLVANYKDTQKQLCVEQFRNTGSRLPIAFFVGKTPEIIQLADCALMVSGSVSLELLARGTPASVVYRTNWPTYCLGRLLVTCRYMSLPNLIAGKMVLPERVSVGNPEPAIAAMVSDLDGWLSDPLSISQTRRDMQAVLDDVHVLGATERAAGAIESELRRAHEAAMGRSNPSRVLEFPASSPRDDQARAA